jgi:hypothetical protein
MKVDQPVIISYTTVLYQQQQQQQQQYTLFATMTRGVFKINLVLS